MCAVVIKVATKPSSLAFSRSMFHHRRKQEIVIGCQSTSSQLQIVFEKRPQASTFCLGIGRALPRLLKGQIQGSAALASQALTNGRAKTPPSLTRRFGGVVLPSRAPCFWRIVPALRALFRGADISETPLLAKRE